MAAQNVENDHDELEARKREELEQSSLPYRWRQTLTDVDLCLSPSTLVNIKCNCVSGVDDEASRNCPVPPSPIRFRARELNIVLNKRRILVGFSKRPPVIEGELHSDIKLEGSTWYVDDDTGELVVHLEKVNQVEWWKNVVTHHPAIDTTKIVPEKSNLSDLDGETRAMVEKMMFDQQQKSLGLPTSDEKSKMALLEQFKNQHPEMDFSKAKVSF